MTRGKASILSEISTGSGNRYPFFPIYNLFGITRIDKTIVYRSLDLFNILDEFEKWVVNVIYQKNLLLRFCLRVICSLAVNQIYPSSNQDKRAKKVRGYGFV